MVHNLREFSHRISRLANSPDKLRAFSKGGLKILGRFVPVLRELEENFYQFENSIVLDNAKLKSRIPGVLNTDLDSAIRETLAWERKPVTSENF